MIKIRLLWFRIIFHLIRILKSAQNCKCMREFAYANDITHFYEVGQMGIEHALLPEQGVVTAGDTVIGADSHTCTYGAIGAFSTGVGSTDAAVGMAYGKAWFKVPSALKFVLTGKPGPVDFRKRYYPAYYRHDRCGWSPL